MRQPAYVFFSVQSRASRADVLLVFDVTMGKYSLIKIFVHYQALGELQDMMRLEYCYLNEMCWSLALVNLSRAIFANNFQDLQVANPCFRSMKRQ